MVLMDDNSAVILSLGPFALPTMQRSPLHVLKFDPSLVSPTLPLSLSLSLSLSLQSDQTLSQSEFRALLAYWRTQRGKSRKAAAGKGYSGGPNSVQSTQLKVEDEVA